MIELALSVCLLAEPHRCREVALTYSLESVTVLQCTTGIAAQAGAIAWVESHPGWFVKRSTCRLAGQVAKI